MKSSFVFFISVITFCLLPATLSAQLNMTQFLASANNDPALGIAKSQLDYLNQTNLKSPLIHRFEFRTRTNDFNISQDEFRFRIAPTNPFELSANKEYFHQQKINMHDEMAVKYSDALKDRYEIIIELIYLTELKFNKEISLKILKDQVKLESQMEQAKTIALDNLIEIEKKIVEEELDMVAIDYSMENLQSEVRFQSGQMEMLSINSEDLIDIPIIKSRINSQESSIEQNLRVRQDNNRELLDAYMLKVDKAKDKRNIGYFQTEYDNDNNIEEYRKNIGFQVGIRIPITNADRPDQKRDMMDFIGEQKENQIRSDRLKHKLESLLISLNQKIKQFELIEEKRNQWKLKASELTPLFKSDPKALLESQTFLNDLNRKSINLKNSILSNYLSFLEITGQITQSPPVNFLDKNLKAF